MTSITRFVVACFGNLGGHQIPMAVQADSSGTLEISRRHAAGAGLVTQTFNQAAAW